MEMHADDRREHGLPPGLARPARRALAAAGIQNLEQLTRFGETEIVRLHGIGPNALAQLRHALDAEGLSFAGTSVDGPN
jgi:hypothetical protein